MRKLNPTTSCRRAGTDDHKRHKIMKSFLLTFLATAALLTVIPRSTPVRGQGLVPQAKFRKHANAIANRYIVVLSDDAVRNAAPFI